MFAFVCADLVLHCLQMFLKKYAAIRKCDNCKKESSIECWWHPLLLMKTLCVGHKLFYSCGQVELK